MADARAVIVVGSNVRCASGYQPYGTIPQHTAGRVAEGLTGDQGVSLSMPRAVAEGAGIAEGRWLWISHPRRGVSEWLVVSVDDGDGRARDTVSISASPLRTALPLRGTIRTINARGSVTNLFTPPALRVDSLLSTYFLPNLATDGLSWLGIGTIAYSGTIQVGPLSQWNRGQLLAAIENATGYEFELERIGSTGYQLNLVRRRGQTRPTVLLEPGVNVDSIQRTRDLISGVTVVEPRDASGNPMGEPWWRVTQIVGTGPYWVTLVDPAEGPAVIRENGQLIGNALVPNDGLPVTITDSRASDSSVQVADRTGLVVGGLAAIWKDSTGAYLDSLSSPTGLAARDRVVQSVAVPTPGVYANRLVDPALRGALTSWDVVDAVDGGADVFGRYDEPSPAMLINGALASGVSSLVVDGGAANLPIRFGHAVTVAGTAAVSSGVVVTSATGGATVPITGTLPLAIGAGVAMSWDRNGVNMGSVTTNGAQALGAGSLVLTGFPTTPVLTAADTLVYAYDIPSVFYDGGALDFSIPSGSTVVVVEQHIIPLGGGSIGLDYLTYSWTTTTTVAAGVGATSLSYDLTNQPVLPTGGTRTVLSVTYARPGVSGSFTFTLAAAPPSWNTALTSTVNLTAALGVAVPNFATLTWLRGTTVLGTVRTTGGAAVATALTITLVDGYGSVQSGDTFSLPAQTLYSASATTLNSSGAGTITLRVATTSAIADNTRVVLRACQDLKDAEFGSAVVLRLRGNQAVAPTVYRDATRYAIYSPIMRVQAPSGSGSYYVNTAVGLTRWAAEASQTQRGWYCLWDVDTGAQITIQGWSTVTPSYTPVFDVETHSAPTTFLIFTAPTRIRMSLHPGGGQVGDFPGGYTFLRWVSLTVSQGVTPIPQALVDGSVSNALWHRAQDLLEARSNTARYRVKLSTVAPFADDPDALITLGGMARLRSLVLGLDVTVRIVKVTWAVSHDDDIELELQVLTPRFTEF